jgi:tetratricopeptide (TPR) repeat protein
MLAGDWPDALEAYQEGLALAERLGSRNRPIPFMVNIGILYTRQGRFDPAEALLDRSLALARQAGLHHFEPICLLHLADLHLRRNRVAAAGPLLEQAETLAIETETRYQLPEIWRLLALVRLADKQPDPALDYARRSVELARDLGMGLEEGVSQRILGQVLLATKQVEPARLALEASLALLEEQDPYELAQTKLVLGEAEALQLNNSRRIKWLAEARATLERLGVDQDMISSDDTV